MVNKNRIKIALDKKDRSIALEKISYSILHAKADDLDEKELNLLVLHILSEICEPIAWTLIKQPRRELILKANKLLENAENLSYEETDRLGLRYPLEYLLHTEQNQELDIVVGRFIHAKSTQLQTSTAYGIYLINKHQGLRMMVDIYLDVGIDHDSAETIEGVLLAEMDCIIRSELLARADRAHQDGNIELEHALRNLPGMHVA